MRGFLLFVLLASFALIASCQYFEEEKRSAMGGSAFGGLDRIPLSVLRKYYATNSQQKRAFKSNFPGYGRSFSMG